MSHLRAISPPFQAAPPSGVRVRTRLPLTEVEAALLWAAGRRLGTLAARDLGIQATGKVTWTRRKRMLTASSSSRWAGAITRTSRDQLALTRRNQVAHQRSLRAAIRHITARLETPVGTGKGPTRGYASPAERFRKRSRLQHLAGELAALTTDLVEGRVHIVRGGRRLLKLRHNLEAALLTEDEWRERWESSRMFLCADGETGKNLGNETIRWNPVDGGVEVKLPGAQRLQLARPVTFPHRGDEVAARALARLCIRYDISFDATRQRWYLDASWHHAALEVPLLPGLTLAVDLNHGFLATRVLDRFGNPCGVPVTIPLLLEGLAASTRDGHVRQAVAELVHLALAAGCTSISIENLNFEDARESGRETMGRGSRGKRFRRTVAGLPTRQLASRLVALASRHGIAVLGVDPAYTSRWGAQHWLAPLSLVSAMTHPTRHDAAAVVIGRRALGYGARRRSGVPGGDQRISNGELPTRPCSTAARQVPSPAPVGTPGIPEGIRTRVAQRATGRGHPDVREDRGPDAPSRVAERH